MGYAATELKILVLPDFFGHYSVDIHLISHTQVEMDIVPGVGWGCDGEVD